MIITNEKDYKEVRNEIDRLQEIIDGPDPNRIIEPGRSVWIMEIARMKGELAEYDELKAGHGEIKIDSMLDLPIALVRKRILLGMTQKELAAKLGFKKKIIQYFESNYYDGADSDLKKKVAKILGVDIPASTPPIPLDMIEYE
jgi:HTH-type transcriptional regulator / antitoxin HipB